MNSFSVARLFGIKIKIDASWFIIFILLTYTFSFFYFPYCCPETNFFTRILLGAFLSLLWFFCILLHEFGHSLTAKKLGFNIKEIILFVFGGVSVITQLPRNAKEEFLIAIAGPVVSFSLSIFFLVIALILGGNPILDGVLNFLIVGNFFLGAFNLVPAFPLDGGRILRALLWNRFGELKATKLSLLTGKIFSIFLMIVGVFYILSGEFLNGMWLILLGYFIKKSAENNYKQIIIGSLFKNYKVEQFMQIVKPVFYDTKVNDVINYYLPFYKVKTLPAVGKDGKFYLIDVNDINKAPPNAFIEDFLKEIQCFVSPYDDIYTAYDKMKDCLLEEIPVIYKNTLLGIIRKSIIEEKLKEIYKQKEL